MTVGYQQRSSTGIIIDRRKIGNDLRKIKRMKQHFWSWELPNTNKKNQINLQERIELEIGATILVTRITNYT